MIHKTRPIFSTQFHPEAKGGPMDSAYLFDIYVDSVRKYKASQGVFQVGRDEQPSRLLADLLGNERVGVRASLYLNEAAQATPAVAAA
jgi:carbamoyl-phosphate synthase small subunit